VLAVKVTVRLVEKSPNPEILKFCPLIPQVAVT
jgi:hypothetical protein